MELKKNKIIVIAGPTATGKTDLSIELAKKYNAVILNADSTQVYKEPLIATAKITEEEKEGIEHYLLDLVSLNEEYTLFDYQRDGRMLLDKFIEEGRNVIIVGGSGLYIKALLYDYKLEPTNHKRKDYSKYTNHELKLMADKIDPNNDIHENNRQRLERYITYFNETGKTINKTEDINKRLYDFTLIGLEASREELYDHANKRVDKMFKLGLLEESKKLYDMNLKGFSKIIGYRELEMYFNNDITLEDAKELIKQNTRRYAKRQFTWFKNQMKDITWFKVDYKNFNNTIEEIKKYLE
jgi:tRNA dimethylallyltransferase